MSILFRIELYVKDIEKSLTFYQQLIGLGFYGRNKKCGRFNYGCFSLLVTSDLALIENHYCNNKGKSSKKGTGYE